MKSHTFLATVSKKDGKPALSIKNTAGYHDFLYKATEGDEVVLKLEIRKSTRTEVQNRSLHLFFEHIAQELNDAGYTVQLVLKEKVDLDWDTSKVKELLWRPAQQAILKKKSTTELTKTGDIDKVFEHLNRHLGEKFGIHCPFPSEENKKDEPVFYKDLK